MINFSNDSSFVFNYLVRMSKSEDVKSDSKLCILQAAAALFAKLGLDKCSTREIAKQADSNISLISYYFGGKEGLYKEVMRSHALEIKERASSVINNIENADITKEIFVTDMGKIIDNIIQSHLQNPELSKIFAREKLAGLPFSKEIHTEIFYPLILNFYKLIEIGQKKGFVKPAINPALFFLLMTEGISGLFVINECKTKLGKDCEAVIQDPVMLRNQIMDIYLSGVLI